MNDKKYTLTEQQKKFLTDIKNRGILSSYQYQVTEFLTLGFYRESEREYLNKLVQDYKDYRYYEWAISEMLDDVP